MVTGKRRLHTATFEAISVLTLAKTIRMMLNIRGGREYNWVREPAISFVSPDFYMNFRNKI